MDRTRNDEVFSPRAPRPVGPYPHARRFGNLLFLSGIGPRDRTTDAIAEGIEAQTRSAIENVKAILEDAGSSLERVIDVTVFLTDLASDFAAYNRVYGEYFGEIRPTRTTVGVVALPTAIAIELKVVAEAPAARTGSPSST
ncbi:MAG TPA: Rid family detoxifying hydrolase [Thermoanaerobaculia bacterium]|nr:Rid family detoxifying hydrolase [Thermoanaerobaculia bacterium]